MANGKFSENMNSDVLVVGAGPGGGSVALELVRRGARVTLLEQGRETKTPQNSWSALPAIQTQWLEMGYPLIAGKGTGGSTLLYFATALEPPYEMFDEFGLDLRSHVEAVKKDLPFGPLAPEHLGQRASLLRDSARSAGLDWKPLNKLIHQDQRKPGDPPFAGRWSSAEWIQVAREKGLRLVTGARVHQVLSEKGRAIGVEYEKDGTRSRLFADQVVVSAGGVGTPGILQRSGLEAGQGLFVDPLLFVMGQKPGLRAESEIPMSCGVNLADKGIVLTDIHLSPEIYAAFAASSLRLDQLFGLKSNLTVMVKIRDDIEGNINGYTGSDKVARPISTRERAVLEEGTQIARQVLTGAGAQKIFTTRFTAAHPGGSARIGETVDSNLETELKNLFVSDCSVIPRPWGLPPTLSLLALGHRLATHLAGESKGSARQAADQKGSRVLPLR